MSRNRDRRERLAEAGQWLRATRERRFPTAKSFAEALGIDASQVSNYERGASAVDDDRAEQIAAALRMPLLEVRRGLQMWVPTEQDHRAPPPPADLELTPRERAIVDLVERTLIEALRTQRGDEQHGA